MYGLSIVYNLLAYTAVINSTFLKADFFVTMCFLGILWTTFVTRNLPVAYYREIWGLFFHLVSLFGQKKKKN